MKTKNKYISPVKKKDFVVAISTPEAHDGFLEHAIDFLLPEGTEVIAACDGKVTYVKVDSSEGGLDDKYIGNKYLNFVTIEHKNDELSQYCHLKYDGACVKVGQKVKAGDVIGYSGNTGFSSDPHLHFHVCVVNDSQEGWETLEIQFEKKIRILRKSSDFREEDMDTIKEAFG